MKKPFVIASLACACAVAAHAGYETSFTGIGESATGATALAPVNGTWDLTTHVTNGEVTWDGTKKLVFDLDDAEYIEFNATAGTAPDTNTVTTVKVKGVFSPVKADALPTSAEMTARAAQVGFVIADVSGVNTYYAWTGGTASDASDWKALTAAAAAAPDVENETELLVTFNYSDTSARTVSFAIIKSGTTNSLAYNSSATIALTSDAAGDGIVKGLSCYGSGSISAADGLVEIGIATVGGKKYGTLAAAATAATSGQTVEVLRPTTESDVTLKDGVKISDPGQNASGAAIAVQAGATVGVVATAAEANNGVSGNCSIPLNFTVTAGSGSTVNVELPAVAANKEAVDVNVSGTTATFKLQTKESILAAANPGNNKALSANVAKLRQFIAADTALNTADVAADVSTESITTALQANGDNGIPKWESYVLGIDTTDSIKPVTAPAGDTDTAAITLSIPAIDAAKANQSGDYTVSYTVSYKVGSGAAQSDPAAIKVPLATGTSDIKVVLTPAVQQ